MAASLTKSAPNFSQPIRRNSIGSDGLQQNPLIDMIRTRGGIDPDQVVNALGEAFAREFGNPAHLPLQAILFEATRP